MEDEMSNVCERKVCSLEEIDNEAKTFHDEVQQWYAKKGHDKTEPVLMYYRGLPDANYKLVPRIGQKGCEATAIAKEERVLRKFLEGLRILCTERSVWRHAKPFLELFSALGPDNNKDMIPPKLQLRLLALGQHYGLPTRLLDWSECPYIATCFAVTANKNGEEGKCGALYLFHDRRGLSVQGGARIFPTTNINQVCPYRVRQDLEKYCEIWGDLTGLDEASRIQNQKAAFTVQRHITQGMDEQLEEAWKLDSGRWAHQKLWRLKIPADRKKDICKALKRKAITHEALLSGPFQNLCRGIANCIQ
jgi:hypothetical protein